MRFRSQGPFSFPVFSRAILNMADNRSFSPSLRLYISQFIRVNRRRRFVMQVDPGVSSLFQKPSTSCYKE